MKKLCILMATILCLFIGPNANAGESVTAETEATETEAAETSAAEATPWYANKSFAIMVDMGVVNVVKLEEDGNLTFTQFTSDDNVTVDDLVCSGIWTDTNGLVETVVDCYFGEKKKTYEQALYLKGSTEAELAEGKVLFAKSSLLGNHFLPAPIMTVEPQEWTMASLSELMQGLASVAMALDEAPELPEELRTKDQD